MKSFNLLPISTRLLRALGTTWSRRAACGTAPQHRTSGSLRQLVIAVLLTLSSTTFATDLAQCYEKAYFLETAKGQTKEAISIYKDIINSEASDDEPYIVTQALERLLILYRLKENRTIQEKVDSFDFGRNTLREHIVKTFGEPERYAYMDKEYSADNLPPHGYTMYYPQGFTIQTTGNKIHNITFKKPIYNVCGLTVGSDRNDVLNILPPKKIMEMDHSAIARNGHELGVLYTNLASNISLESYITSDGHGFYFLNGKTSSISIYQYLIDRTKQASK